MARLLSDLRVHEHGEQAGSVSAVQLAAIACKAVTFKAASDNVGTVAIGRSSAVTLPGGTTDQTSGWPLAAGEETPVFPCANLSDFYIISTNAGDDLSFICLR